MVYYFLRSSGSTRQSRSQKEVIVLEHKILGLWCSIDGKLCTSPWCTASFCLNENPKPVSKKKHVKRGSKRKKKA